MRNKGDGAEEKRLVSKQIVSVVGDCNASFARFCSISYQIRSQSHGILTLCPSCRNNSFVRIICSKFCALFWMIKMKSKNCIGPNSNIVWQMGDWFEILFTYLLCDSQHVFKLNCVFASYLLVSQSTFNFYKKIIKGSNSLFLLLPLFSGVVGRIICLWLCHVKSYVFPKG